MSFRRMFILTVLLAFVAFTGFAADTWYITTVAGTGKAGYSGDGGPATEAMLNFYSWDLWVDVSGCLYIADGKNNRIRKVDTSGIISTVAGNGTAGFSGDGGPATAASLNWPGGVDIDQAGNLYIGDWKNRRIRKVDTSGIITTVAGNGKEGYSGDGGPAVDAELVGAFPRIDPDGDLYIIDSRTHTIRRVDGASGIITTVAGTGTRGDMGDGGPATKATLNTPDDTGFDRSGNLYVCDVGNNCIRRIDTSGIITTVAGGGGYGEDGSPATKAYLTAPKGVCVDADGNIYIADTLSHRIRMVDTSGVITTIAGTRVMGYSGDEGPAIAARLSQPGATRVAPDGSIYFIDWGNQVVRKLYRK